MMSFTAVGRLIAAVMSLIQQGGGGGYLPFTYVAVEKQVKVHKVIKGKTFGADEALLSQLTNGPHLSYTNWQESDVIILFCPISSRVGSDVHAAMRDMPGDKKIILVLMHHTRDADYSTAGTDWSEIYKNVSDFHVLFHESIQGLPNCAKNREAVHQIQEALDQYSTSDSDRKRICRCLWRIIRGWWDFCTWKVQFLVRAVGRIFN